ncbi:hypothetical protein H257_05275 [Aphanomyces astaci]|uniref:Uncharacterized protein n=1 Tax=Aphanomyces astaci TaxID=112090 RepID=W4GRY7_APHAT|nr:hypothetical protein H257_05275 [Aphanomyces astaci]ETV81648.1 hypothetical protein H257_05275 [Aphanomyces astaci]|eukprot:XP_009828385.1 hypothetical protein H257_05275 [Aphanomyces astaci]
MPRRCHKSHTIGKKRKLLALFDQESINSRVFRATHDIPRSTWIGWQQGKLMKYVRRDEHILTSMHIIAFMKTYHAAWLDVYKVGKRDSYKSLLKLCHDFTRRHNFSQRVPCYTKMPSVDMEALRNDLAGQCWNKYHAYKSCDILNVDETDVNYDIPPGKIWAGKRKSSKVDNTHNHSDGLTAVLTCRANVTW